MKVNNKTQDIDIDISEEQISIVIKNKKEQEENNEYISTQRSISTSE